MSNVLNQRNERGQALVEFAIVVPLLFVVLLALIQFGIVLRNYVTLTDAVRTGARKASVSRNAGDPVGAATEAVRNSAAGFDQANLNVSVSSGWKQGDDVTVEGSYPYDISILGLVVKSGNLDVTTTDRVE